jgi:hypoxanthine phosphoribosyltransferase
MEKELVIAQKDITEKIKELGRQLSKDYKNRKLLVIGVLNGAFIFAADLVREIQLPLEVDFVRVASYGNSSTSQQITLTKDIELPIEGKDILIVEDIIDTGKTLSYLKENILKRGPSSLSICTFIDKKERREVEIEADYVGFEIQEGFLVGYGLDYAQQHRQYPEVFHLKNV